MVISGLSSPLPTQEERWRKAQTPVTFLAVGFPWRRKESIRTRLDRLSFLVHLPHSQVCSVNLKMHSVQLLPEEGARLARRRGHQGWGEEGRKHGANVLQPEPQNCDPPRRVLLEEKEKT